MSQTSVKKSKSKMAEENKLRDLFNKIANERGYSNGTVDVQDISSEGANYCSTLHLAIISAPHKEDLKLFAKVACIGEALRASKDTFAKGYEVERRFYSELVVAFERLYDKHGVTNNDRLHISKYYGHDSSRNKETLVLENLAASGFESFDRFKPFDWDYASSAVEQMAKFHALGIAAKKENLKELVNIVKLGTNMIDIKDITELFKNQVVKYGKEIIKEGYRAKLGKHLTEENMVHDLAILWKPKETGFLIHSDYRPSNLMHRRKNGTVEIVPLDFQTLRFGTLVSDLLYFIWCGSDSEFRQKHYQQLLEHYYIELTIALKNLHVDINEVYPRKTFENELEDSKTVGLMAGLGMASILMVEPENAPVFESYEGFALVPSIPAQKKMNEVVEDYIRWEII